MIPFFCTGNAVKNAKKDPAEKKVAENLWLTIIEKFNRHPLTDCSYPTKDFARATKSWQYFRTTCNLHRFVGNKKEKCSSRSTNQPSELVEPIFFIPDQALRH